MGNFFGRAIALDFGIQWIGWIFASSLKTERFYDLTGALTNILLIVLSLRTTGAYTTRQIVNSGFVLTWAARLGLFLFSRVLKDGGDRRFDVVKNKPGIFWIYWTIQVVLVNLSLVSIGLDYLPETMTNGVKSLLVMSDSKNQRSSQKEKKQF